MLFFVLRFYYRAYQLNFIYWIIEKGTMTYCDSPICISLGTNIFMSSMEHQRRSPAIVTDKHVTHKYQHQ